MRRLHPQLTQRVCHAIFRPTHVLFQQCINLWNYSVPLAAANGTNASSYCAAYVMISPRLAHHLPLRAPRTPLCAEAALRGRHVVGTPRRDSRCTGRHKRVARPQTRWAVGEDHMEQVNKRWGDAFQTWFLKTWTISRTLTEIPRSFQFNPRVLLGV